MLLIQDGDRITMLTYSLPHSDLLDSYISFCVYELSSVSEANTSEQLVSSGNDPLTNPEICRLLLPAALTSSRERESVSHPFLSLLLQRQTF